MRTCHEPIKGLTCIYGDNDENALYCLNNKCEYREIDYKRMMEDKNTYKREHSRIKQR
jgi:hypothetical protein